MPENSEKEGHFGKGEPSKSNVQKLVKALLLFAKGDLTLLDSQPDALLKVEWVSDNELKVTGKYKKKTPTGKEKLESGIKKQALWQLAEKTGNSLKLPERRREDTSIKDEDRQKNVVADVYKILEDLRVLKDDRPDSKSKKTNKPYLFTLTLKHKDASIEENLAVVQQKLGLETTLAIQETGFLEKPGFCVDWLDCCRKMLPTALSTNPLLFGDGVMLTIKDIVPLELVERKQRPQHQEDFSPERFQVQASTESEVLVTHDHFFEQVLAKGNSTSKGRKIAIIGEPGAGKTTFLQEIANWIDNRAIGKPIFVRLADLQGKSLEEYLLEDWLKDATGKRFIPQDIQDEFVEQFNAERVWLLLDGVDEMAYGVETRRQTPQVGEPAHGAGSNFASLQQVASQMKGWVAKARIVLTCRLNVWDADKNALYAFDTYRTKELSYPKTVRDFICHFFSKASDATTGEKLIKKLEQSQQRIRDLIKNPLRLTLLCRTWKRRQGELPQTKAELYKRFVDTFYDWKDNLEISQEKRQLLNQALGELAIRAIDAETTKFRLRETFIYQELDKFDKSLFGLACDLGWINKVGVAAENPDEAVYAFFHPTFQEYFAALTIDDWHFFLNHVPDNPAQGTYRIFEPQWKEVFLLWLGREDVKKEQKEELIRVLVEFDDGCGYDNFYTYQAYFLAAAGIAEFKNCNKADEIVAQLFQWGFGYPTEQQCWVEFRTPIQEGARVTLLQTNRQILIHALSPLLDNSQYKGETRHEIMKILGEIGTGNDTAIKALERITQNIKYENECCIKIAASGLAKIANGQLRITAINTLIDFLPDLDAVTSLENIDFSNLDANILNFAIAALTKHLKQTSPSNWDDLNRLLIAQALSKIAPSNQPSYQYAIDVLYEQQPFRVINGTADSYLTSRLANFALELDSEVINTVKALINLMCSDNKQYTREQAAWCLEVIVLDKQFGLQSDLLPSLVNSLKACLLKLLDRNDHHYYKICFGRQDPLDSCYNLLCYCAQNMNYPTFYQAWHQQEGEENTNTSITQILNQADLPQSLQKVIASGTALRAIANDTQLNQTIHLICIDTSKFIDADNPAAKIYTEMIKGGCPKCDDGIPKKMAELQTYWDLLESDQRLVLVFYEGKRSKNQGLSKAFLNNLSKFDGAICVITDQPKDDIPLNFFTPSQSVEDILAWIREICLCCLA